MKKFLFAISLGLLGLSAAAQSDSPTLLIVNKGEGTAATEQYFEIDNIALVAFSDSEMTLTTADELSFSFPNAEGWSIAFEKGEMPSGLGMIGTPKSGAETIQVYDASGRLVGQFSDFTQLQSSSLAKGVYIVKCNGKSFKIKK